MFTLDGVVSFAQDVNGVSGVGDVVGFDAPFQVQFKHSVHCCGGFYHGFGVELAFVGLVSDKTLHFNLCFHFKCQHAMLLSKNSCSVISSYEMSTT